MAQHFPLQKQEAVGNQRWAMGPTYAQKTRAVWSLV